VWGEREGNSYFPMGRIEALEPNGTDADKPTVNALHHDDCLDAVLAMRGIQENRRCCAGGEMTSMIDRSDRPEVWWFVAGVWFIKGGKRTRAGEYRETWEDLEKPAARADIGISDSYEGTLSPQEIERKGGEGEGKKGGKGREREERKGKRKEGEGEGGRDVL